MAPVAVVVVVSRWGQFGRFTDEQSSRMDDLFALRATLSTTGISGY